jgi:hypothetical protein
MAADEHTDAEDPYSEGTEGLSSRIRALLLRARVEERRKSTDGEGSGGERRRRGDQKNAPGAPES